MEFFSNSADPSFILSNEFVYIHLSLKTLLASLALPVVEIDCYVILGILFIDSASFSNNSSLALSNGVVSKR